MLAVSEQRILPAGNPGVLVAGGGDGCTQGRRHGVVILDDEHVHCHVLWLAVGWSAGLVRSSWLGQSVGLVRY
ncbi:hypothetical protein D3C73_1345020 [compost metagenome]